MSGKLASVRRDIVRKVRQVGILETIKHGTKKIVRDMTVDLAPQDDPDADPFDKRYGTDTAQIISVGALDIPDDKLEHSNRYEAVVPDVFDKIIRQLKIRHQDFAFVDIGSGKGRALLLASFYPFDEIIGVEISAALTAIAERNFAIFKDGRQKCFRLRAVCLDGAAFEPPARPLALYLNNPFDDLVMKPLVETMEKSALAQRRIIHVVYQRPLQRQVWDESKVFRVVCSTPGYVIYTYDPDTTGR